MMKKGIVVLASILTLSFISCKDKASDQVKEENVEMAEERDAKVGDLPVMTFEEEEHDFGTINEGEIAEHTFKFTNTGKAPLVIVNAKGSCGCTVPEWPKEPIAPGATGEMLVKFNSTGKPNQQSKQVTITANTEAGTEVVRIKAFVTPKADNAEGTPKA